MDSAEEHRLLSLCSGYGGLELGISRACPNVRTIAYVEVEAFACANLVAKMEAGALDAAPIWTDIKTFNAEPFRNRVHIITAGYPCQGESCAGKQLGEKDPRWLWPHIERIIQTVRPVWFFGENVPGHLTLGYPTVYCGLRNLGYTVEAGLFTAAEIGAPHKRQRLFVLAHRHDRGCETIQELQEGQSTITYSCQKLANARGTESRGLSGCQRREDSTISPTGELADAECAEQGEGTRQEPQAESGRDRLAINRWPARSGQQQYEWEEPRVVGNAERTRQRGARRTAQRPEQRLEMQTAKTQSRLGRAADGTAYPLDIAKGVRGGYLTKPGGKEGHDLVMEAKQRADRLRLLGNGVVAQQAEKAFRNLMGLYK